MTEPIVTKELLFEIGTEEIPAGFVPPALSAMARLGKELLDAYRIDAGRIITLGTPRRLVLVVSDVAASQRPETIEKVGPPVSVCLDTDGKPNEKALGFARGQGVAVEDLKRVKTDKGEYMVAVRQDTGRATRDVLPEILGKLIADIPFKKSMRWMDLPVRFVRPVHWILAVFGGQVVPLTFGNVTSSDLTRGHRFHAPQSIKVNDFSDYLEKIKKAFVIVDPDERRTLIERQVAEAAASCGGAVLPDPGLIDEIVYLTEFPFAAAGSIPEKYLVLPRDVMVTAMRSHQRYFSIVDDRGQIVPRFITVNNTKPKDIALVMRGNERVLTARLEDARFYFEEDLKIKLADRVEALKSVVFHAKLGTSYEKVMRFRELAGWLADRLAPEIKQDVLSAAYLAKADLDTGMVAQFPTLQGAVGREYAIREGIKPSVAAAISEHYLPQGPKDPLPEGIEGTLVSLADKMDTVCGFFGVGQTPTGTADPYALRRNTIAILNIIVGKGLRLSLSEFIDASIAALSGKITRTPAQTKADVLDFFRGRFSGILVGEGYPADVAEAVLSVWLDDPVSAIKRTAALSGWKSRREFSDLAGAIKRVANILKGKETGAVDESVPAEDVERALLSAYRLARGEIEGFLADEDFDSAMGVLLKLKGPIDDFFNGVMVMDKDEKIRDNRLALLNQVRSLFLLLADFSLIE
jgi:glycyl-tRNA synthetase beta chain